MLALGLCNLAGSAVGSMPAMGSFSRSAVSNASGVRSPLSGLYTGVFRRRPVMHSLLRIRMTCWQVWWWCCRWVCSHRTSTSSPGLLSPRSSCALSFLWSRSTKLPRCGGRTVESQTSLSIWIMNLLMNHFICHGAFDRSSLQYLRGHFAKSRQYCGWVWKKFPFNVIWFKNQSVSSSLGSFFAKDRKLCFMVT